MKTNQIQNHNQEIATEPTENEATELKIEQTAYAEPIAHVGSFTITNSLLNSWLAVALIVILVAILRRKISLVPRGIQSFFETIIEALLELFDGVTGSREKSIKYAPFIMSFFFFILINNWMGILPGVGSIGQIVEEHGEKIFVPFFRGGAADLNTTLALALIGVVSSHLYGIKMVGAWKHLNKFINVQALIEIPKKFAKDPTVIIVNPIKAFISLIELIGEAAKVASLSFRLFGNIFAGEVLLASMSAMFAFGVPIPFIFLEIMVGVIQALVFSVLILVYLTLNSAAEEH